MNKDTAKTASRNKIITQLTHLGRADTLFRDLYFERAGDILNQDLSRQSYLELKQIQTRVTGLPNQIRNALVHEDWPKVHDLSGQLKRLQETLERQKTAQEFAQKIYECSETPIDPFSPGMHRIAGSSSSQLAAIRTEATNNLKALSQVDKEWKTLYQRRLEVFTALRIQTNGLEKTSLPDSVDTLQEEAAQALRSGNMARLEQLAEKMMQAPQNPDHPVTPAELLEGAHPPPEAYHYKFPQPVLEKARKLGLEVFSVPSRAKEFAPYRRFAWHPTYSDLQGNHTSVLQVPDLHLPSGLPEALKSRIQLFAIHPFINSAGVRFLPSMVAEDVLVENFPEPDTGVELTSSGLLEALGIKKRYQISRQQIEAVLQEKGSVVLRDELGLDPVEFKLICIPPDLHLRIGQEKNWGQKKIWTHFDGYMIMADNSRRALAGGDVRYGGIYDLLGLNSGYESDRIIVRFAVVQRRRMAIWQ